MRRRDVKRFDMEGSMNWMNESIYTDKHGNPINIREMEQLLQDKTYRQVGVDTIGKYTVSTVWLGFGYGIWEPFDTFETIIFFSEDLTQASDEIWRYKTFDNAMEGHQAICNKVRKFVENGKEYSKESECKTV